MIRLLRKESRINIVFWIVSRIYYLSLVHVQVLSCGVILIMTVSSQPPQSPKQAFQKQSVSDKKKFFETAMEESQKPSKPGTTLIFQTSRVSLSSNYFMFSYFRKNIQLLERRRAGKIKSRRRKENSNAFGCRNLFLK